MTRVASFEIEYTAFLNPEGVAQARLPERFMDPDLLKGLYRQMVFARTFDSKAISLQRTGRLGTYASSLGQEAIGVGAGFVMRPDDILLPSFREHPAQLCRGVTPEELFLFWGGDERGSDFAGPREDFPVSITVGGHAPHAVGVALAFKLRKEPRAAVCVFGDGATSKGDVYEAMNVAGVWRLPVLFVVTNNRWAISTPQAEQTASETLAQKAIAAGFAGQQVDGNDVVAVSHVLDKALHLARGGGGPSLVECLTYRLGDHTTVDDASRYRDDAQVSRAWREDPIARLRSYLLREHGWSKKQESDLLDECAGRIEAATEHYLAMASQPPETLVDHTYAELPADLLAQRAELLARASLAADRDG